MKYKIILSGVSETELAEILISLKGRNAGVEIDYDETIPETQSKQPKKMRSKDLIYKEGKYPSEPRIDIKASLKHLGLTEKQLLAGRWSPGSPQHRIRMSLHRSRRKTK